MNRQASRPALDQALSDLERHTASPHFTRQVMSRIEEGESSRSLRPYGNWILVAAALVLVAAVFLPIARFDSSASPSQSSKAAAVRSQYEQLRAEFDELKGQVEGEDTYVYLTSSGRVDLVVDLQQLSTRANQEPGASDPRLATQTQDH